MLKPFLHVPRESRILVVVSLAVLIQVLALSFFGLAALKGQVAETEKNSRDLSRRALDRYLVGEVVRRVTEEEAGAEAAIRGFDDVEVPGEDFALARAVKETVANSPLIRRAFVVDSGGSWFDPDRQPVWPAGEAERPAPGSDGEILFEEFEATAAGAEDLDQAIADLSALIGQADRGSRPLGLLLLARLLTRAERTEEAIAAYTEICKRSPTAIDPYGMPLGPAAAAERASMRITALRKGGATGPTLTDDLIDWRRILLLNRHSMEGARAVWERGRLRDRSEEAARLLALTERERLQRETARLDADENALLTLRRTFGDDLLPIARGWRPGGRLVEVTDRGPLSALVVPLATDTGTTGAVVFELDLDWLRLDVLPRALTDLPLPEGVFATVLDDTGRPVVAGDAPGDRAVLAESRFGDTLPFWRSVVYLGDTGVVERRTAATRRSHYAVMAAAIAGMLAAGWFVVRTVRRELRVAQLKSDFLSTVTHELKTPLTSIRMFVETLSEGRFKDEEERKEYLGVISRETERLSELIQRVLDLARLEGKRGEMLSRAPTDVPALVRETADLFRLRTDDRRAELTVETGDGLATHNLDPAAAREVILNLLSNAQKYGGQRIELAATAEDGAVVIAVTDDGIGISEADQGRVFEKFYRANDTLARDAEGSGLGLALVREIARAHGGRVSVKSRPGEGSVFTVTLPAKD